MTKKQMVFGAILGVAVGALAVDRYRSTSPDASDSAAAVAVESENVAVTRTPAARRVATTAPTTAPAVAERRNGLAERLESVTTAYNENIEQVADAFTPDVTWVKPPVATTPASEVASNVNEEAERAARTAREAQIRDQFVRDHKLTAVMKTSRGGIAVIDGRMLRVGQSIGGFEVATVTERAATLKHAGQSVTLKLQGAPSDAPLASADR